MSFREGEISSVPNSERLTEFFNGHIWTLKELIDISSKDASDFMLLLQTLLGNPASGLHVVLEQPEHDFVLDNSFYLFDKDGSVVQEGGFKVKESSVT